MNNSETFVKLVGKMPFTGKHAVRMLFREGTRAAQRGDGELKQRYQKLLGGITVCNTAIGGTGLALGGLFMWYGIEQQTWQFSGDIAAYFLAGLGYTASAAADLIILNRLGAQPVNENPTSPPPPVAVPQLTPSTYVEKAITFGGTLLASIGPFVHMAIYDNVT